MIALRHSWLYELTTKKFNGSQALIQAWPRAFVSPHRTTLWRWLKGRVPIPSDQVLPLSGALDLDPFVLFETTPESYATLCLALMQKIAVRYVGPLGSELEWAHDLIVPSRNWPPSGIATRYFNNNREWRTQDFFHTARDARNYFQRLTVTAEHREFSEPQVWHFAFRVPGAKRPVWTPYGFIQREGDRARLYQFRGQTAELQTPLGSTSFVVETWFGIGPAEFRVASLHPFELAVVRSADTSTRCLRFA
jgi:hypothetical protein